MWQRIRHFLWLAAHTPRQKLSTPNCGSEHLNLHTPSIFHAAELRYILYTPSWFCEGFPIQAIRLFRNCRIPPLFKSEILIAAFTIHLSKSLDCTRLYKNMILNVRGLVPKPCKRKTDFPKKARSSICIHFFNF